MGKVLLLSTVAVSLAIIAGFAIWAEDTGKKGIKTPIDTLKEKNILDVCGPEKDRDASHEGRVQPELIEEVTDTDHSGLLSCPDHNNSRIILMEMPQSYTAVQGEMLFASGEKKLLLPLLYTSVKGSIGGFLARISVTQYFVNSGSSTIEALYTFPLPENSTVDSMVLITAKRKIRGVIKKRDEARRIYEQARNEGKTESLLEQERPNIFAQSIANIIPGDTILVTISYMQELKYKNGKYSFHFPMVVGPRYRNFLRVGLCGAAAVRHRC